MWKYEKQGSQINKTQKNSNRKRGSIYCYDYLNNIQDDANRVVLVKEAM